MVSELSEHRTKRKSAQTELFKNNLNGFFMVRERRLELLSYSVITGILKAFTINLRFLDMPNRLLYNSHVYRFFPQSGQYLNACPSSAET